MKTLNLKDRRVFAYAPRRESDADERGLIPGTGIADGCCAGTSSSGAGKAINQSGFAATGMAAHHSQTN